ncbi:hypothetical protein Acr_01g0013060 [Actinidia rufa]|uniref:Uncharacterized protein n=1 Tax=Actinidia rufa TaxID=165716 RepID=A0A7J0E773_9ERIC|nr:hypothetical protein Acr_01g0013060 [Actinidia rufa]
MKRGEEIEDRHSRQSYSCVGSFVLLSDCPARAASGAVSEKRLSNDQPSLGWRPSAMATALSSGTKGLRARSVATIDRDLCPIKASVKRCSHRAPAQGTTELAL